ncbi:MAG TPA: tripartite tricarboxylate transporter substrate binding protein, partial [Burkholderiales bacterium]|nr:tripartite tricarboxylate transporter substrate binding protein [Burkholderiales bacterium]
MKLSSRSIFAALGLLAGFLPAVHAADFPNKPIRWIIPFPPGGSNDVLARYIGIKLSQRMGQQVVIDNRGGANGIIGTDLASQASADGYTILIISTSFVLNASVRKLPYDIQKSFDPIAMIASSPNSIVTHPTKGYKSLQDLVSQAKAKPGAINYAHTGVGGFNHFGGELFKRVAGIDMVPVPYKGGGPAMIDVIAGNMLVMFTSITQVLGHVRAGRIKMLAVGAANRNAAVPDVPTVIEAGFPGYEMYVWWGIAAPAGVPRDRAAILYREITAVLQDPETRKWLEQNAAAETQLSKPPEIRTM